MNLNGSMTFHVVRPVVWSAHGAQNRGRQTMRFSPCAGTGAYARPASFGNRSYNLPLLVFPRTAGRNEGHGGMRLFAMSDSKSGEIDRPHRHTTRLNYCWPSF